jgi:DNA-binding transcriptional MerR regulator
MTKSKDYSIQQLSKETKIPASTVSYYAKQYSEYFHPTRPDGAKYPVFDPECIEVLEVVRKGQKDRLSKPQITEQLAKKFSPIYEQKGDDSTSQQSTNKQASNKSIATTTQQVPNLMQTVNQLAEFSSNQVQLTEHYRLQNQQQSELIKELTEKLEKSSDRTQELEVENKKLKPKKNWWRN